MITVAYLCLFITLVCWNRQPLYALDLPANGLLHPHSSSQFLASYVDSISPPDLALGVSYSFQLNLSCGYLLPAIQRLLPLLFLTQLDWAALLVRRSAWLPLPDQPPRLWLIRV
jgi:hypothetical protein